MPALVWTDTEEKSAGSEEKASLLLWYSHVLLVSSKTFQLLEQEFAGKAVGKQPPWTASLKISWLIPSAAHCADWDIPITAA